MLMFTCMVVVRKYCTECTVTVITCLVVAKELLHYLFLLAITPVLVYHLCPVVTYEH